MGALSIADSVRTWWIRGRQAGSAPILFMHVPKTAGTSMRRMLQASLGMRAVYPSDADLRRRPDGNYPATQELLRTLPGIRPYRVLIGHVVAGIVHGLPVVHRVATMLREPVQRSLSMLAHLERHRGLPPERVIEDERLRSAYLADYQTRLFGADRDEEFGDVSDARLERALHNLAACEFVGITERFTESSRLFDRVFGTAISSAVQRSNVLRPGGRGYEEFIPRIEPLVARDRVLYESARARFDLDLQEGATVAAGGLRRAA